MFVAIPTAIPEEPLINKFGTFAGKTEGSYKESSKLSSVDWWFLEFSTLIVLIIVYSSLEVANAGSVCDEILSAVAQFDPDGRVCVGDDSADSPFRIGRKTNFYDIPQRKTFDQPH